MHTDKDTREAQLAALRETKEEENKRNSSKQAVRTPGMHNKDT